MLDVYLQMPVNLGRPFPATSTALINCRSDVMKPLFSNMTLKLNIFNVCKQIDHDDDDAYETNLIE